jgi:hypothetical protein
VANSPAYAPSYAPSRALSPRIGGATHSIVLPLEAGTLWMIGAITVSLMLYYFIGIDQGALSVFGKSMVIHEFVHDARHFLGFPCH